MAHKVHPKSFRIKGTEDWNIRGFYGRKMPQYLEEDFLIKDYLRKKLVEASVSNIEIEHSANKVNVIIETARPGIIIGRGGGGVDALKKEVENKIQRKLKNKTPRNIKLEI
jgi:small subunit ribosomal protein S3